MQLQQLMYVKVYLCSSSTAACRQENLIPHCALVDVVVEPVREWLTSPTLLHQCQEKYPSTIQQLLHPTAWAVSDNGIVTVPAHRNAKCIQTCSAHLCLGGQKWLRLIYGLGLRLMINWNKSILSHRNDVDACWHSHIRSVSSVPIK